MAKKNFNFKKLNLNLGNLGNLENLKETLSDTISTVADKVLDFADSAADNAKIGQQIAKLFLEKKKEEFWFKLSKEMKRKKPTFKVTP